MTNLPSVLRRQNIALVLGNGINRFDGNPSRSWDRLLKRLIREHFPDLTIPQAGAAPTELFDILELAANAEVGALQRQFCEFMSGWRPAPHHRTIMQWAQRHGSPVLTSNFDELLGQAADCELLRPSHSRFTDFYPWESRFALRLFDDPCAGFGIWHVNGIARYHRSIRLGLTHYMAEVQRARTRIHGSGEHRLFAEKNQDRWPGHRTWLHVVFNMPLVFIGIGLEENEVFLRWLLIERAKYFRRFHRRKRDAWYIYSDEDAPSAGKLFYLQSMGIVPVRAPSFESIYRNPSWNA